VTNDHVANPEELVRDLERLGPTFIKLGQMLSTRPDFLPPEYLEALEKLQDDVDPLPFETIRGIVESELGVTIDRAFRDFETEAYAGASIGQVHRAVLRDGRRVVVKVQRPNLQRQSIEDLQALDELAGLLDKHTDLGRRARFVQIIEALREVMVRELDYRQEAENNRNLRANLRDFPMFVLPAVIDDFTTERVITLEYVEGAKITDVSPVVLVELDRRRWADDLFRIYLHQLLVDGLFHADPHPGNLLLTQDRRIALIDFGMVARVTPEMQRHLVKLILAIADGRAEDAADEALYLGRPFEKAEFAEAEFRERIAKLVAANQGKPMQQMQTGRVLMEINAVAGETGWKLPTVVLLLGKTLLNLDKVVALLDPSFDPNESIQRHTGEILQRHSQAQWSLGRVYQTLMESAEFVERLPERLNRFADLVSHNRLKLTVDAIDERRLIAGLQKIANRITTGLILAAMIIGASLMMRLQVRPMLFGYPAIALAFFLFAAITSLILLWRIAYGDEPDRR
jgi:predicted unusual protein kinase regulating ubiquinone biosynthesis (AarF/ABC1/UbiB family)